jgi:hypothetical protein
MHDQVTSLYCTGGFSYRAGAVGTQRVITPLTPFRWIDELGGNCNSLVEAAKGLKPK